jgi:hypothetical protein
MEGEAAQEIAQKRFLKPFSDPDYLPCFFWEGDSNE